MKVDWPVGLARFRSEVCTRWGAVWAWAAVVSAAIGSMARARVATPAMREVVKVFMAQVFLFECGGRCAFRR